MRTGNIEFLATDIKEDPFFKKLGGALTDLVEEYEVEEYETNSGAGSEEPFSPSNSFLQVDDERVVIDFIAESEAAVPALLKDLENLGGTDLTSFDKVVSGWFPIEKVNELVEVKYLEFARAAMATTNVGIVTSQADPAMNADTARTTYTVDGDGITVGVLSDSYDDLGGEAADVTSGDLPSNVNVLDDLGDDGIDEGRAMAQLVYDVAPGSDLAFHTASKGQANFAQGIIDLKNAGSDVIVDDVIYFAEPMFQDGIIAQAVDQVVDAGVPYFSSAGNQARQSYESAFRGVSDNDYLWHDFNSGSGVDIFQKITLPPGGGIRLAFQWDQPFKSAGPVGSSNDLDVFLLDESGIVIAAGADANVGGDAFEFFSYQNPFSFNEDVFLLLGQYLPEGGPTPGFVKYVDFGGDGFNIEYDTKSPPSYGHANAAGAEAVGAAFYDDTPRFGTNPPVIEDFSAAGGVPILFDTNGTRLTTPELRQKPEIVAPDGTNTTFFGSDVEGDGFPNFFGTSAAAPHAAAVAALMLEAKPNATPAEIYAALEKTALDMNDPFTAGSDPGFDNGTGYGLIQADAAIAELLGNVNEAPVITPSQTLAVAETAANNTVVGTVVATDPDAGQTLTYEITGGNSDTDSDGQAPFAINAATGEITVNDFKELDFETIAQYNLTVQVTDNGEPVATDTETVTINVEDVNEAPVINPPPTLAVAETAANNTVVGTVVATDPDAGQTLTYEITAGNSDTDSDSKEAFAINAAGEITVNDFKELDFETKNQYSLTVQVTDNGEPVATDTETVTINVEDGAEAVINLTQTTLKVVEGEGLNQAVVDVTVTGATNPVSVAYRTSNITAQPGSDYTATTGTLTFNPGETSKQITVPLKDNNISEPDETFKIILEAPSHNAVINNSETVITITDTIKSASTTTLANGIENLTLTGTGNINGTGNSNPNILTGNGKNNILDGGAGNDQLRGASGADVLIGGTGNDNLNGGAGADNMSGGKGNDVYTVDNIADVVTELVNEGNDIVNSLLAEYTLADTLEQLTLTGTGNINGNGNNLHNLITGNSGDNILRGGAGADIFSFVGPTHGVDNILDFSGGDGEGDRIRVNSINFGGGLVKGRLKSDQFVIDTEATEAEHRFIYDNSLGRLFYDADGLGGNTQVHLATLTGNPELLASDIFIF